MALTKIPLARLNQMATFGAAKGVTAAVKSNLDAAYTAIDAAATAADLAKIKSGTVAVLSGANNGTVALGAATWNGKPVQVTLQSAAGALAASVVQFKAVIAASTLTVTLIDQAGAGVNAGSNLVFSYTTDGR